MSVEAVSDNDLVKIKFPLERDDRLGPSAEWLWAIKDDGGYRIDNIPASVTEAFFRDLVSAEFDEDGALTFKEVVEEGPYFRGHVRYNSDHLENASFSELTRELRELYGAKVEGFIPGIFGFAYEEDELPQIFEHLVELYNSGIVEGFYMEHLEDQS